MSDAVASVVLFDLDGTLVDSLGDLAAAAQRVGETLGRAPVTRATIRPAVSRGGRGMLAAAFPDLSEAQREPLLAPFLAYYAEAIAAHSAPFDGIADVLERIEASQSRWGVVTNKAEGLARRLLDALDLSPRCAVLIGGDTLSARKPDPLQLQVACERLGVACSEAIYIGDDERDVAAARAAGMRSIAAAWGYRDAADDIETWGADATLATPRDLLMPGALRACRAG